MNKTSEAGKRTLSRLRFWLAGLAGVAGRWHRVRDRGPRGAGAFLMDTAGAPAFLRERVEIREAVETDNEALLALTRATPMDGTISLRIDRDPDFFALLRLRGPAEFSSRRADAKWLAVFPRRCGPYT